MGTIFVPKNFFLKSYMRGSKYRNWYIYCIMVISKVVNDTEIVSKMDIAKEDMDSEKKFWCTKMRFFVSKKCPKKLVVQSTEIDTFIVPK